MIVYLYFKDKKILKIVLFFFNVKCKMFLKILYQNKVYFTSFPNIQLSFDRIFH
jgi:hypothetical protein